MKSISPLYVLLLCIAVSQSFNPGASADVTFWNKLGSETEILNSEIGPGIQLASYLIPDWAQAQILPGQFGNGLFVNHDTNEGWANDGGNFFAIDLAQTTLTPARGTIEFWFTFLYDSGTHNHAPFFKTIDAFANHFNGGYPRADVSLQGTWGGWDYGTYGKWFCFSVAGVDVCTPEYSAGPGGALDFQSGTTMHFAFVWDASGIDGTADTIRIYVDGRQWAATQEKLQITGELDQFMYIGSSPNYDGWDHYYNAVKGITDNFIIRDVAKTNFSDRFNENPLENVLCSEDDHCYRMIDESMSWDTGKAYCESIGGNLLTITSPEEQSFVFDNLVSDSSNDVWLGMSDMDLEGSWHWVTDEVWTYDNWDSGEPDNCLSIEHYGLMDRITGLWYDRASLNDGGCGCNCPDDFELVSTICEWGDVAGDINGDNKVNQEDYQKMRGALGTCSGDTAYIPKADLDGDNCVSYRDFRIWYQNYYQP